MKEILEQIKLEEFLPIGGATVVFNCKECVYANSFNLFSDKLFPKRNYQSLLDLLLTNSSFLRLLFFWFVMKNMKAKVKKI